MQGAGCGLSTFPLPRTLANKDLPLNANLVVLAYWRADEQGFQLAKLPMVETALLACVHVILRVPEGDRQTLASLRIRQHQGTPEALLFSSSWQYPVFVNAYRLCDIHRQHLHTHHPRMHDLPPHLRFV